MKQNEPKMRMNRIDSNTKKREMKHEGKQVTRRANWIQKLKSIRRQVGGVSDKYTTNKQASFARKFRDRYEHV